VSSETNKGGEKKGTPNHMGSRIDPPHHQGCGHWGCHHVLLFDGHRMHKGNSDIEKHSHTRLMAGCIGHLWLSADRKPTALKKMHAHWVLWTFLRIWFEIYFP
jgi:hypothetical protein